MWYGPVGVGMGSTNFHPRTFAHQARVACGFELASSVCVIMPIRGAGMAAFLGAASGRGRGRAADRLVAAFVAAFVAVFWAGCFEVRFVAGLRVGMVPPGRPVSSRFREFQLAAARVRCIVTRHVVSLTRHPTVDEPSPVNRAPVFA
jgi:ABC-type dipeptide/oligopeptide/nickel transport system permease component